MVRTYSTEEVAKLVGVYWNTLHRWLQAGKIRPSRQLPIAGRTLYRWTERDVERVKKYKAAHYRKHTGRRKKPR